MTGQLGLAGVQDLEHLESAAAGQQHVEDDEIGIGVEREAQALIPVERGGDLKALAAQSALEEVHDAGFIFDDEN